MTDMPDIAPPPQKTDASHYAAVIDNHQVHLVFPFLHHAGWAWRALSAWRTAGFLDPTTELERLLSAEPWGSRRALRRDLAAPEGLQKRQVTAANWLGAELAGRLATALQENTAPETAWLCEEIKIPGLHAHLPGALGIRGTRKRMQNEPTLDAPPAPCRFRLERALIDRINQGGNTIDTTIASIKSGLPQSCRLVLPLKSAAMRRLGLTAPALLGVRVDEITVYLSGTRIGQLVVSLTFAAPFHSKANPNSMTAGLLMEGLYGLGHDPEWRSHETAAKPAAPAQSGALHRLDREGNVPSSSGRPDQLNLSGLEAFALRDLAWCLISPIAKQEVRWGRAFTYTVAAIAEPAVPATDMALVRDLSLRFARRHNAAYAVSDEPVGIETVQPFETASHAAAIEGGAVIVSPRGNEFLKNYVSNTAPQIYLPIALAAHKEFLALLNLSQGAAIPIEHGRYEPETIRTLNRLRDHLYNFRLAHRFSTVSLVSMHNTVFEAWRRAFRSEALLKDVSDDVLSAVTYLRDARRDFYERRFGWAAIAVAAGFAFGAASAAVQALTGAARHNYCPTLDQKELLRSLADAINNHQAFTTNSQCTLWTSDAWDRLTTYTPPIAGCLLASAVLLVAWLRRDRN